jgi:SAM-dependent methyltransferase
MIPDQIKIWDKYHKNGTHQQLREVPSPFAELAEPSFPKNSYILELGCGVGRDALYFGDNDHNVLATDSSKVVINQNKRLYNHKNVRFEVLDMRQSLPYNVEFDVVYSNLSLHYYSHKKTLEIFRNIAKTLKPSGILAFSCKSKDESRTKNAVEVENEVFIDPNGHALHRFSIQYARELLDGLFEISYLDEIDEEYNGRVSSIVRCIAKKALN